MKIKEINIINSELEKQLTFLSNLDLFKKQNIFFLDKNNLKEKISENELVDNFSIFKKYPSTLLIKIDQTNFLAYLKKGNELFFLGSNGRLIKTKKRLKIYLIYLEILTIKNFLDLKK